MVARRDRPRRGRQAIRSPRRCLRRSAATTSRKKPFDDYLEARIFDLYDDPMPGRAELEGYCGETASALIQLAALVLDPRGRACRRRSRRPCRLRAGDRRADPADPAASRARPMLCAARRACRRRHVARGVHRRRGWRFGRAAPWRRWRRLAAEHLAAFERRAGAIPPIAAAGIPAARPDRRLSRRDHQGRRRSADRSPPTSRRSGGTG